MKSTNGQHEGNELLRQLIDISQNTLEAQSMQLEVLLRFDRNMNVLADRIERTNEVLGERILQTNQTVQILGDKLDQTNQAVQTLGDKLDQTNQTVHVLSDNMNRLVDISERNFKQSEGNFSLIAHQFGVMNDKLDQVIDLEVWVRSIEADMKEIKRKVG
jgi:methyl-accepting chemotaxis protein